MRPEAATNDKANKDPSPKPSITGKFNQVQAWMGATLAGEACGPSLRWGGTDYACSASGEARSQDLNAGGFVDVVKRVVLLREALLTGSKRPKPQEIVMTPRPGLAAVEYRIEDSRLMAGATLRELTLVASHRAA